MMKLLVIDTETTGLSPQFNKLLTVGMIPIEVDEDRLEILGSKHIFVKHDSYHVDPAALAINKIDLGEHSLKSIVPAKACEEINNFVGDNDLSATPLLGHNIAFDHGFIRFLFGREDCLSKLHHESVDTMHMWRWLKNRGKIPFELRSNLGTLADFFKIDYSKAHDALADCHITAKVYQKMLGMV